MVRTKNPIIMGSFVVMKGEIPVAEIDSEGNMSLKGPLDMNAKKITNLGTPTESTDAATKDYVDSHGGGTCQVPAHEASYDHPELAAEMHEHPNKVLLDTYAQSESDLEDAVTKKHSNSLDHSNINDPTAGQKAALPGTNGTPSGTNKYVTDSDPRNSDARTPLAHGHVIANTAGLQTALDGKLPTTSFSGLAKITVGTSQPGSPGVGDLWVDTN